jgi:VRR-NUC domain
MPYVVLCGPAKNAPDLIVGPFGTAGEAERWIAGRIREPSRYAVPMALTAPQGHGHIQVTERPPTTFRLAQGTVHVATQRWDLERWSGAPDPPDIQRLWGRKPKFTVNGRRSCAELAVVDYLRRDGWDGVWVSAFAGSWLRSEWFPAPGHRTLAEAGAPVWAVEIFEQLRAANDGKLSGFFDVFAWREPDEVRFLEVKVARDRIQPTQRRFAEKAMRFHDQSQFMIIEVPG